MSISLTNETKNTISLSTEAKTGFTTRDALPNSYFDGYTGDSVIPGTNGKTMDQLAFNDPIQSFTLTLEQKT